MGLAFVLTGPARCIAAEYEEVAVYVDGQQVDFVSKIRGGRLPALLVEGHPMVSARFVNEVLGYGLDLHMWPWGIVRIGHVSFKVGCDYALMPVPGIGGTRSSRLDLALAPRTINGRLYVPAVETVGALRHTQERDGKRWFICHEVAWDTEVSLLRSWSQTEGDRSVCEEVGAQEVPRWSPSS